MPHRQIKEKIIRLEKELKKTPKQTTDLEKKLQLAQQDLEEHKIESLKDLSHLLHKEIEEFEVEHPQIVALINQVTTALSNLGI